MWNYVGTAVHPSKHFYFFSQQPKICFICFWNSVQSLKSEYVLDFKLQSAYISCNHLIFTLRYTLANQLVEGLHILATLPYCYRICKLFYKVCMFLKAKNCSSSFFFLYSQSLIFHLPLLCLLACHCSHQAAALLLRRIDTNRTFLLYRKHHNIQILT